MRTTRARRATQGVLTASAATFLALMSHLAAGGQLPSPFGVLVPWALALPVATLLASRRLSLWRLSLSVGITQALFHLLFVLGTPVAGPGPLHQHGGALVLPDALGGALPAADLSMWLWHAAAAVLTIALLRRAERLVLALHRGAAELSAWVRRRVLAFSRALPVLDTPRILVPVAAADPSPWHGRSPLRRRGPPFPAR